MTVVVVQDGHPFAKARIANVMLANTMGLGFGHLKECLVLVRTVKATKYKCINSA